MTTYTPGPFARPFSSPLKPDRGWWSDALGVDSVELTPEAVAEWWDAACVGYAAQPEVTDTLLDRLAAPVDSPWTEALTATLLAMGDEATPLVVLLNEVVPGRSEDGTLGWVGRLGDRGCGRPFGFVDGSASCTLVEPAGLTLAAQMGNAPRLALALVNLGADPNARAVWDEPPRPILEGSIDPDYSWHDLARDVVASGAWPEPDCVNGVREFLVYGDWKWVPDALIEAFQHHGLSVAPAQLLLPAQTAQDTTPFRCSMHLVSEVLMEAISPERTYEKRNGRELLLIDTHPEDHGDLLRRLIEIGVDLDVPVANAQRTTDPVGGVYFYNPNLGDPRLGRSENAFVHGPDAFSARELLLRLHERRGSIWFTPAKSVGYAEGAIRPEALERLDAAFRTLEQRELQRTLHDEGINGLSNLARPRL